MAGHSTGPKGNKGISIGSHKPEYLRTEKKEREKKYIGIVAIYIHEGDHPSKRKRRPRK